MPNDLPRRRLPTPEVAEVTIYLEGEALPARVGDSVAAALLAAGHEVFRRSPVSGAARAPFCMMGVCFECLLEIDGLANSQACMVPVRDGMQVARMPGPRRAPERSGDDAQD